MKDNNLKIGIVGFGDVGQRRKKVLDNIKGIKITAISDIKSKYKKLNKKIKFYSNFKKLLNNKLDTVFISLPNKYSAEATEIALKKNINVFCEKPPARNIQELKKVFKIFKKKENKIKLKYGFNHRYHDSIMIAKKIIDSKKYGKLINIKGLYGKSKIVPFTGGWRSKKSIAGGGILLDQGIHLIDLMRYFVGNFQEVKSFVGNNFWKHKVEDNAYVMMRTKKNVVVMVHSTATQWQHEFRVEITLEKALINLTGILSNSMTYGKEKIKIQPKLSKTSKDQVMNFTKDLSWEREIKEYIDCIKSNKKIQNGNIYDAINVMKMIDIIYKSDKTWKKKYLNN